MRFLQTLKNGKKKSLITLLMTCIICCAFMTGFIVQAGDVEYKAGIYMFKTSSSTLITLEAGEYYALNMNEENLLISIEGYPVENLPADNEIHIIQFSSIVQIQCTIASDNSLFISKNEFTKADLERVFGISFDTETPPTEPETPPTEPETPPTEPETPPTEPDTPPTEPETPPTEPETPPTEPETPPTEPETPPTEPSIPPSDGSDNGQAGENDDTDNTIDLPPDTTVNTKAVFDYMLLVYIAVVIVAIGGIAVTVYIVRKHKLAKSKNAKTE